MEETETARTVLIVDDDPQILRLVEKMLKHRQYRILVSPRPSEALEICRNEPIHLVISDIAMPEMDGRKLAQRIRELSPEMPILLISGHAREQSEDTGDHILFLKKPFFPSDLLDALRQLIPDL